MSKIHPIKLLCIALLAVAAAAFSQPAQAQQAVNANAVYNGWISAYQVADGSNFYMAKSFTDRSAGFWSQGYLIFEAEDAYFQNRDAVRYGQVVQLLNDFLANNTASTWTNDSWDDDLEWIIYAFVRGYEITGNTTYLNDASAAWNAVYTRGWDSTWGGGIWENTTGDYTSKCVLSNAPFIIEGVELYRATGTASYLTESEQVYEWMRSNLFNSTSSTNSLGAPGYTAECVKSTGVTGTGSGNVYNVGLMVNASNALFRATQSSEYSGDFQLAASFAMSSWPILNKDYVANGYFSGDHLVRGMAAYATQNNAWSTYNTWLQNNANAAWSERRTDYNISQNDWTNPTSTTADLYAMESAGSVDVQAALPTQFNLAGTYELQNAKSNLVLDVSGGSTSSGAAVVQSTYASGTSHQLWTFVPTAGGYYQIKNVNSGLVLNVKGHSTITGALVQQYAAETMVPGNDQWLPAQNSDGTFSFYNLNSNMPLEIPGGTTTVGAQFDQAFTTNLQQQKFNLIQPSLTFSGNYELANSNSGLAVNVKSASTSNGGIIQQYAFVSGQNNSLWKFVAAQPGYYHLQNVNSSLDINVTGASTSNGALLQQYSAVTASPYNDQWRPVKNSDGSYSFYNSNSGQALEVPGASTTSGTQLDQWPTNGSSAQTFVLSTH